MSEHATLSPSAASMWAQCPGSMAYKRLSEGEPEQSSSYADEGKLAHDVAAQLLEYKLGLRRELNTDAIDPEMLEYCEEYVEVATGIINGYSDVWIEQRIDLSGVLGPAQFGTGDLCAYIPARKEAVIQDLKYGKGVPVYAPDNRQLILYGIGALDLMQLLYGDVEQVRLIIHQPRLGNVSEALYTAADMEEYREELKLQAQTALKCYNEPQETLQKPDLFHPSQSACRWCRGKAVCEALAQRVQQEIMDDFEELNAEPSPEDIEQRIDDAPYQEAEYYARKLPLLDLISQWVAAVKDGAYSYVLQGKKIPGYKLVQGRAGHRAWENPAKAEEILKSMRLKRDQMYKYKIISPTDAEKLLKKSSPLRWDKLQDLIVRPEPKPAIVPETDKRPELDISATADGFDDLDSADQSCDLV